MSYTVTGYIGRILYTAVVDEDAAAAAADDAKVGCVTGSPNILRLLKDRDGEDVDVTPTGPFIKLDVNDPDTIQGALYAMTHVIDVEGDETGILDVRDAEGNQLPPGTVF